MTSYSVQKIFIAGASDVQKEQTAAQNIIHEISTVTEEPMQIILLPYVWHHETPLSPLGGSDPQHIFNEKLENSDIVVLIVGRKYGKGNTESEANLAIRLNTKSFQKEGRPKPQIIAFFKKLEANDDPGSERQKVEGLKHRLAEEARVLPVEYNTLEEFQLKLTHALYKSIIRFRHSTFKHRALSSFWNLGIAEGHQLRLDIIYPGVDDPIPAAEYWSRRLVPNIVFEDSKAIQKLDKTFRLIGLRSFKYYNCTDIPDDFKYHNRVWLCLPRNRAAQHALQNYRHQCLFKMVQNSPDMPGMIHWRAPSATTSTEVISPLGRYLALQREIAVGTAPLHWSGKLRNIIAKDYGIIARFSVDSNLPMTKGSLKEYFFAGIRGLGTWGAGWYIDRRYSDFTSYGSFDDIQILVEVTYANGRIDCVKDVSKESQSYFDEQNSENKLIDIIKEYQSRSMIQ